MNHRLSPHIEQKIAEAVAGGLFPSSEALIEAAVEQLLESRLEMVPDEHMAIVEAAIESSDAGLSRPMSKQDWDQLHRLVEQVAARK